MNVKRFTGRNSREAMQKVRLAYGDNAVVLSTKPCAEGVEILAMPPESVAAIERFQDNRAQQRAAAQSPAPRRAAPPAPASQPAPAPQSNAVDQVQADIGALAMSTLSFQDYVRERMLKKRQTEMRAQNQTAPVPVSSEAIEHRLIQREAQREAQLDAQMQAQFEAQRRADEQQRYAQVDTGESDYIPDSDIAGFTADHLLAAPSHPHQAAQRMVSKVAASAPERQPSRSADRALQAQAAMRPHPDAAQLSAAQTNAAHAATAERRRSSSNNSNADSYTIAPHELADHPSSRPVRKPSTDAGNPEMMRELRAMKGMIEERFGALAFMEKMQKNPRQAQLATKLMECGFSPALIRKLVDSVTEDSTDELGWAGGVLQRNLITAEQDQALEDQGGVYALVGSTGVGKTTSTAKLAAAFATKHGAANLGLITLDAYRLGAHEQLRAYGRILGVPVHTAHDRVALEDLLELLAAKRMVLIDTAGLAQRDTRTRELLEMLSHPSIKRVLVVNAAAQGETIEDVLVSYKATSACGVVLSKLDEAVKLGPALDALIRHRVKVVAIANGQRVPEDWHRLTAQALIHRALRSAGAQAWRMDSNEVNLMFAAPPATPAPAKRSRPSAPRNPG
jgi:flagellar biosynthesis protein FlhF